MVIGHILETEMLDQNKRRTLKILGITPLVSLPVVATAAGSGHTNEPELNSILPETTDNQGTGMPLQIQILDTISVPDNNVVLRNTSDEPQLISRFLPGHIYFNGKIMDLNEAVGNAPLRLQAGRSKAFDFKFWPVVNAGPVEYVWADHAVEALNENTSIITLGAFMADTKAVIYANTAQATVAS